LKTSECENTEQRTQSVLKLHQKYSYRKIFLVTLLCKFKSMGAGQSSFPYWLN